MRPPAAVVAGAANVDIKVRSSLPPGGGVSTPGRIRLCPGGVARNAAEALARMGAEVRLLSAVGQDAWGDWVIAATAAGGVDCTGVLRRPGQTGLYVMVNGAGIADTAIIESVDPRSWPGSAEGPAPLLVLDANLLEPVLAALAAPAERIALIGTSPAKVARLRELLPRTWLICLTAAEAAVLVGVAAPPGGEPLARAVQALGPAHVLLTEGPRGLGLLVEKWMAHPARTPDAFVDATGAGDVAAAAVIYGLAAGSAPERVLAAGAEAAAMTIATWGNVPPEVGTVWSGT
ncbi:MAG: PfkB family carbohydrate kinase [bacterium]